MSLAITPARPVPVALLALGLVVLTSALVATLGITAGAAVPGAMLVVASFPLARRWRPFPLVLVIAASATAYIVFLPTLAEGSERFFGRDDLRQYGVVVALVSALAALLVNAREHRLVTPASRPVDLIVLAMVPLTLIGVVAGLLSGNTTTLIASDSYRLLLVVPVYVVVTASVRTRAEYRTALIVLAGLLLLQQGRDLYNAFLGLANGERARIYSALWMQNAVGVIAFGGLAAQADTLPRRALAIAAAAAMLAVGLAFGFRTYAAIIVCVAALPFFVRPSTIRAMPRIVLASAFAVVMLAAIPTLLPPVRAVLNTSRSTLVDRVTLILPGNQDDSGSQRWVEVRAVRERFAVDPLAIPWGFGSGAEYALPPEAYPAARALSTYMNYRLHHIHNSYASIMFRWGAIGLALIGLLFAIPVYQAYRLIRRGAGPLAWIPFLTIVAFTLTTPYFSLVPGDLTFSIAIGLTGAMLRFEDR